VTSAFTPSAPAEPGRPADAVEVGRVLGAWGIKGGIKVKPFSSDPQALFSSKRWFLEPPEPRRPGASVPPLLRIVTAKEQGDGVVATAQELPDRTAAEALQGARIFVSRASFPTPDEGEYYWVDLIGLAVVDRQGLALGTVAGLIETGPHCVLSIQGADATRAPVLIPFVDAYVDHVDLPGRCITVDWDLEPDGQTGVSAADEGADDGAAN
jgi:16S rRNA processing protein RimM